MQNVGERKNVIEEKIGVMGEWKDTTFPCNDWYGLVYHNVCASWFSVLTLAVYSIPS